MMHYDLGSSSLEVASLRCVGASAPRQQAGGTSDRRLSGSNVHSEREETPVAGADRENRFARRLARHAAAPKLGQSSGYFWIELHARQNVPTGLPSQLSGKALRSTEENIESERSRRIVKENMTWVGRGRSQEIRSQTADGK
ncbi:hypothetical protein CVT25_013048 [Psilocybe cyanescens]|uniref:Uncharacterized protein n=1 Tax=Psilocybe cyanescens TaxID=93625 RepID=A0A409X0V3_PSICY|nr:hypothetical protein CVT25_013048 [Psilocybe cyanescens]